MKSKFGLKKGVALVGILLGTFMAQANAQGLLNVFPLYAYNTKPVSYMMGVVKLPKTSGNISGNVITIGSTTNATTCVKYITTFHKFGDKNAEVVKLQKFLNKYNGAHLNEKGFYGPATMQEVKNFQYAYGIKPTGAQYEKTTDIINLLNCGLIAKKDRVVYAGQIFVEKTDIATATISPVTIKVYPNELVTPSGVVKTVPGKNVVTKTTKVENGFFSGIKSDFDKIKENYKAYALVLVLVLALFWFLRKAATE